ncbi:MAG: hypothetical protein WC644_07135 [Ignavibacteria bacterium]
MAKVRDTHLGNVQGQIGSLVYKMRGTKKFVGAAPKKSTKPDTESAKAVLSSMGVVSKFASAVCKINKLKKVWKVYVSEFSKEYQYIESSTFNKVVAVNRKLSSNNYLSTKAMLTPENIYDIKILNYDINSSKFNLEFGAEKSLLDDFKPQCDFFLLIHLSYPLEKKTNKIKDNHKFIILKKSESAFKFEEKGNTFSFPFEKSYKKVLDEFSKAMVFFSIVFYENDVPVLCENAEGFILKGFELHEADVKEHERIKSIKTKKQIKSEKAKENPDFQSAIV